MDNELGDIEGGLGGVLSPFGLSKPTIEAADSPISDTIDDTVRRTGVTNRKKIFPHLDSKRFATIGDFFPSSAFISNRFDFRGGSTVGFTAMARLSLMAPPPVWLASPALR